MQPGPHRRELHTLYGAFKILRHDVRMGAVGQSERASETQRGIGWLAHGRGVLEGAPPDGTAKLCAGAAAADIGSALAMA